MNKDELDASIPVLTEIIAQEQDFIATAATPLPFSPPAALHPSADETIEIPEVVVSADVPPSAAMSDSQWEALEHKISERVLSQLQTRIDFVLEHQVRDSLASALQLAVDGMLAEIKRGLHHTLEEGVASAVAQEIAQLKTDNKSVEHSTED